MYKFSVHSCGNMMYSCLVFQDYVTQIANPARPESALNQCQNGLHTSFIELLTGQYITVQSRNYKIITFQVVPPPNLILLAV